MSARSGFAFRLSAFQLLVSLVAERAIRRGTLCESLGSIRVCPVDSMLCSRYSYLVQVPGHGFGVRVIRALAYNVPMR